MSYLGAPLTSNTCEWYTPQYLFDELNNEFGFTLDACATAENAKCEKFYTIDDDGLSKDWSFERVFMNPPYGRIIGEWMRKAYESAGNAALTVSLVPSRTDTKWWHDYAIHGEVRFIKGRVKFGGAPFNAPFPSAIVIFKPRF